MGKMYLLLLDTIDVGHAVNGAAHAGGMIQFKFPRVSSHWEGMGGQGGGDRVDVEDPVMADWYDNSFRKCSCKVTQEQFDKAKTYFPNTEWFAVTESAFDNKEIILVFKPRDEFPKFFKTLPLYT